MALYHIRCKNPMCGFVVDETYYERKPRFTPGLCAKCGAPLVICEPYTDEAVAGVEMVTDPVKGKPGQVRKQVVA